MAALTFQPPEIDSSKFSWHKPEPGCARGTCELSDLGPRKFEPPCSRLYNDACDEGFVLVSHRTGRKVVMLMSSQDMNGDEIAGWRFTAWLEMPFRDQLIVRTLHEAERFTVLIIND
jgi:hypothetical protein